MSGILASQAFVEFSTLLILVLTLGLAIIMSYRYVRKRSKPLLYWSTGMWFFVIGVLLEVIFAFGIYSEFLIALYLFVVAMVVESLAIGSMQLIKSIKLKSSYYLYSIITTVLLAYSLYASNIGNVIFFCRVEYGKLHYFGCYRLFILRPYAFYVLVYYLLVGIFLIKYY